MYWFRKGDRQGDLTCKYHLGMAYAQGRGVVPNTKIATAYFRTVEPTFHTWADQGNIVYQRILGDMYLHGYGVPPDQKKAVLWFNKAAAQGDRLAANSLTALGNP